MHLKRTLSLAILAVSLATTPAFAQSNNSTSQSSSSNTTSSPLSGMEGAGGLYDKSTHTRSPMLSIMGFLPYSLGLGIGVSGRYTIPLVHDGFIESLNDSVELELGADLAYVTYGLLGTNYFYTDLVIPVEGRWTFYFTPQLAAYAKVAFGYEIVPFSSYSAIGSHFHFNTAVGGLYKLGEKFNLRAELGYNGIKVGVGFEF